MKKIILLTLTGFIICTAYKPLTDYRDSYTGSYFCNRSCQRLNAPYTELTTYNDTLTIIIEKDQRDSMLQITIGQNSYRMKLNNGRINASEPSTRYYGNFFASDSISFIVKPGLAPNSCSYRGKKK